MVTAVTSQERGCGFKSRVLRGSFCPICVFSLCLCGSLRVLWLPPIVPEHACEGIGNNPPPDPLRPCVQEEEEDGGVEDERMNLGGI